VQLVTLLQLLLLLLSIAAVVVVVILAELGGIQELDQHCADREYRTNMCGCMAKNSIMM
jgi:hypothetical protein